jgi:Erv1 / Alr family
MESPQNQIWGPALWRILHSSAERIGTKKLQRLPQEEMRIWIGLLNSLRYSLPCPHCKKHYTSYLTSKPIITFNRDIIRVWLYELHQNVNQINNKVNEITFEQMGELYGANFEYSHYVNIVMTEMTKSLRVGWITRNDIQRTLRFFEELKRFYDFF